MANVSREVYRDTVNIALWEMGYSVFAGFAAIVASHGCAIFETYNYEELIDYDTHYVCVTVDQLAHVTNKSEMVELLRNTLDYTEGLMLKFYPKPYYG